MLELRYLDFVYQPMRGADGNVSGVIVLGVDVTESKHAEEVILQSEKLNADGRLASSIAHEINNPLEAVTNHLFGTKSRCESESSGIPLVRRDRTAARLRDCKPDATFS